MQIETLPHEFQHSCYLESLKKNLRLKKIESKKPTNPLQFEKSGNFPDQRQKSNFKNASKNEISKNVTKNVVSPNLKDRNVKEEFFQGSNNTRITVELIGSNPADNSETSVSLETDLISQNSFKKDQYEDSVIRDSSQVTKPRKILDDQSQDYHLFKKKDVLAAKKKSLNKVSLRSKSYESPLWRKSRLTDNFKKFSLQYPQCNLIEIRQQYLEENKSNFRKISFETNKSFSAEYTNFARQKRTYIEINDKDIGLDWPEKESKVETIILKQNGQYSQDMESQLNQNPVLNVVASGVTAVAVTTSMLVKGLRSFFF